MPVIPLQDNGPMAAKHESTSDKSAELARRDRATLLEMINAARALGAVSPGDSCADGGSGTDAPQDDDRFDPSLDLPLGVEPVGAQPRELVIRETDPPNDVLPKGVVVQAAVREVTKAADCRRPWDPAQWRPCSCPLVASGFAQRRPTELPALKSISRRGPPRRGAPPTRMAGHHDRDHRVGGASEVSRGDHEHVGSVRPDWVVAGCRRAGRLFASHRRRVCGQARRGSAGGCGPGAPGTDHRIGGWRRSRSGWSAPVARSAPIVAMPS